MQTLISSYFTDTTHETLRIFRRGDFFILSYDEVILYGDKKESSCEWVADNLIYACNELNSYTLKELLIWISHNVLNMFDDLKDFDKSIIPLISTNIYTSKLESKIK